MYQVIARKHRPQTFDEVVGQAHVKQTLRNALDQRRIAGLGNIYVCEALNRARLHPDRPSGALSAAEARALAKAVRETLEQAVAAGGSSLRDYVQASGELGYFQHSWRVYGREGCPCPCGRKGAIVRRTVQSGRSTFFCPACQK